MSNIRMRVAAPEALRMIAEPVRVVNAVSPKVSFESVEGGVRVTVQDVEGTHVTLIPAGRGEQGVGIASITMNADYTLTITLDDGTSYTTPSIRGEAGADGQDGQDGADGVSPSVTVTDITGGHRVTITDAEHPQGISFDVMNGETPDVPVQDVQVNGTSVVTDGVANVPAATNSSYGVVRPDNGGLKILNNYQGIPMLSVAESPVSYVKSETTRPITASMQHNATFYGLAKAAGDTTQKSSSNAVGTYTDEAKKAIRNMIGASDGSDYRLIYSVDATDSSTIEVSTDLDGDPISLESIFVLATCPTSQVANSGIAVSAYDGDTQKGVGYINTATATNDKKRGYCIIDTSHGLWRTQQAGFGTSGIISLQTYVRFTGVLGGSITKVRLTGVIAGYTVSIYGY